MKEVFKYLHEIEKETDVLEAYQIIYRRCVDHTLSKSEMDKKCEKCNHEWPCDYDICREEIKEYIDKENFYINYGICKYWAELYCSFEYFYDKKEVVIKKYIRNDADSSFKKSQIVWDSEELEWDMLIAIYGGEELHILLQNKSNYDLSGFALVHTEIDTNGKIVETSKCKITLKEANEWAEKYEPIISMKKHLSEVKDKKNVAQKMLFGRTLDFSTSNFSLSLKWLILNRDTKLEPIQISTFDKYGKPIKGITV